MSQYVNTRKHPRFNLDHQILIIKPYTESSPVEAKTFNISLGGVGVELESSINFQKGETVNIQCLGTQSVKGLSLMASVARQENNIVGLEFIENTPEQTKALKEFILMRSDLTS